MILGNVHTGTIASANKEPARDPHLLGGPVSQGSRLGEIDLLCELEEGQLHVSSLKVPE